MKRHSLAALVLALILGIPCAQADDARRGYEVLINRPLLTPDFSQRVFDHLWEIWPDQLRNVAAKASVGERRVMAFQRYGLTLRPHDESEKPLQYVVDQEGNWTMNCFACHGGSVYGTVTPGAPNNQFDLQTLTEEIRATKFRLAEPLSRMDVGSLLIPLGTSRGTTNAVVFGMGLMRSRDEQLNYVPRPPGLYTHHDLDAPPWWHFHKRPAIYIDGFAAKGHRALMQFMLIPENDADFFQRHEDEFRDVYAYLSSLRAPRYPGPVDEALARQGKQLFEQVCSECHGTYGNKESYPNRRVPIGELGTDGVRLHALTVEGRQKYARSWFAHFGQQGDDIETEPDGYVAPPLDGVWASPPYFHNGSVPTLWHVLHPRQRPTVWRRTDEGIDRQRIGFQIETVDRVPPHEKDAAVRRSYFDSRRPGKSNRGHDYPDRLDELEKTAVLEYLKTL